MKRKSILFSRIIGRKKNRIQQVIGLIGTHNGAGVTHTGLLLAFYLGMEMGKKTAFIECNSHHDLEVIEETFEWSAVEANSFSFGNITFFKEVMPDRIPEMLNDDFDCLILDFGTDFINTKEEFLRCGKKIIVGGSAPWEQKKSDIFWNMVGTVKGNENWVYLIPFAPQKIQKRMQIGLTRKIYSIPYNPDPIIPSKYTCRFFDELFQI